jgi:hypothetical protein
VVNEEVREKIRAFDMLLLDNDRIIKMVNMYTDESVN